MYIYLNDKNLNLIFFTNLVELLNDNSIIITKLSNDAYETLTQINILDIPSIKEEFGSVNINVQFINTKKIIECYI